MSQQAQPAQTPLMRRPIALAAIAAVVVIAIIVIVVLLTRGSGGPVAEAATIKVAEITNQVQTGIGTNPFAAATVGQSLSTGDSVKTLADSQARVDLAVRDFTRAVRTTPSTVWKLGQFGVNQDTIIELSDGKVFMWDSGNPAGNPGVQVVTPAGVAAVRGTWMSVAFNAATGVLELDCYRGSCELSNSHGTTLLTDQQTSRTTADSAPDAAAPMSQSQLDEWQQLPEVVRGTLTIPELTPTPASDPTPTSTPSSGIPNLSDAVNFDTLPDFTNVFNVLAYQWTSGGVVNATYRMERIGDETIDGVPTTHVKMTTGDGSESQQVIEAWSDGEGTVRKMILDGQDIPADQLQYYSSLASISFFAPLASIPDLQSLGQSYFAPGSGVSVTTSQVESKTFGEATAKTYVLQINISGIAGGNLGDQGTVTWEISDFGKVTLFTGMSVQDSSGGTTSFEVTEVSLR